MRQAEVRAAYMNPRVQWFIAGLIMGNFFTNIVEKQIDPRGQLYPDQWTMLEAMWNIIFIGELGWNMYGTWYRTTWKGHFLTSSWNIFDVLVVAVSIPTLLGIDLGSASQLRMLRAFRVFRLFKRIKSLNHLIVALVRAIPGIANAAVVMILVMCIFAILGVDLFGDWGDSGEWVNINNDTVHDFYSLRGMTYGSEYYSTFFRSLFTLFQVMTTESWAEIVARPVIFAKSETCSFGAGTCPVVGSIFYVLFVILCTIVLVNVAVAVLLEKMVDPSGDDEANEELRLNSLPETAQIVLGALDLDGDGVLNKSELQKAANLLRSAEAKHLFAVERAERHGYRGEAAVKAVEDGVEFSDSDSENSDSDSDSDDDDTYRQRRGQRRAEKAAADIAIQVAAGSKEDLSALANQLETTKADIEGVQKHVTERRKLLSEHILASGKSQADLLQSVDEIAQGVAKRRAMRKRRPQPNATKDGPGRSTSSRPRANSDGGAGPSREASDQLAGASAAAEP